MKHLLAYLLLGSLSMFFGEVLAGSSQIWFFHPWSLLLTLPLYLTHLLFFLAIAIKTKKTSISQLYLLGILFGLYEAVITKVLWAGYIGAGGPGAGTIGGLATAEYVILIFFWHPIMSFVLPILTYQALSKKSFLNHSNILTKTPKKSLIFFIFPILVAPFIAQGNEFNLLSTTTAILGSLLLILLLQKTSRTPEILTLGSLKKGFYYIIGYLVLLYILTFFLLLPENLPQTLLPYISIILSYTLAIVLFTKTQKKEIIVEDLHVNSFRRRDLIKFIIILTLFSAIFSLIPTISTILLVVSYLLFSGIGIIIFSKLLLKILRNKV